MYLNLIGQILAFVGRSQHIMQVDSPILVKQNCTAPFDNKYLHSV